MPFRELLRRELAIVFGARVTWLVLGASALLVGHSFVLAVDLFSAASRSALGFGLMQREMDPLAGVVRPMLGGLYLSACLLLPVLAARGLAVERERKSYGALALSVGGTSAIVAAKGFSALLAGLLLFVPVLVLSVLFVSLGGHLGGLETCVACTGHLLHVAAITGVALAAAAGSTTVAQATTAAVGVSLASWAVDAGEGFAALTWLGRLEWASVSHALEPFERGILSVGASVWLLCLLATSYAVTFALAQLERPRRRWGSAALLLGVGSAALVLASHNQVGYDLSEQQRSSLPAKVVSALRALPDAIALDIYLDADDGRRTQLERDTLAKLRLARPELTVRTPLDGRERPVEGEHDEAYGRIVVHAGKATLETRSTSRRELTTLIFEACGKKLPDWSQASYPGYPTVIEGSARTAVAWLAYALVPGAILLSGWFCTRSRRRPS